MSIIDYRGKVLRDPVYGNLAIPYRVLLDLVDAPEFQRLRNIRQLGMCFTTFHGAEHSRFQHALGAMWLMVRVLDRWRRERLLEMSEAEQQSACCAALLHDLGHGPFSHALERVFSGLSHEELGRRIVALRLRPILERHGLEVDMVLGMLEGSYPRPVFHELLASQLDVDRMDYLQRDSLYTGVKYGLFDCERILLNLTPIEAEVGTVCALEAKGTEAVEEFLFSRYFMHWQVYFHRTVRSSELLLRTVLERGRQVYSEHPGALRIPANLRFLFEGDSPDEADFLEHFLGMDDFDFFNAIKLWQESTDPVLADLSRRFVQRRLFKALSHPGPGPVFDEIQAVVQARFGDDFHYYLREDNPSHEGFGFAETGRSTPIRVLVSPPNGWQDLSEVTRTEAIRALGQKIRHAYMMVAPECRDEVAAILARAPGVRLGHDLP